MYVLPAYKRYSDVAIADWFTANRLQVVSIDEEGDSDFGRFFIGFANRRLSSHTFGTPREAFYWCVTNSVVLSSHVTLALLELGKFVLADDSPFRRGASDD